MCSGSYAVNGIKGFSDPREEHQIDSLECATSILGPGKLPFMSGF